MNRDREKFNRRVMGRIETHDRMAPLYQRAVAEGFRIAKSQDRRGIEFALPPDISVDLEGGSPDPRYSTAVELMEHEGELFDLLEAGDALAEEILRELSPGEVLLPEERPPEMRPAPEMAAAVPLVAGGEGRPSAGLGDEAKVALCLIAGIALVAVLSAIDGGILRL